MSQSAGKRYRAGDKLEDLCRSCKLVRGHTVAAAGPAGEPLRVVCDYCNSHHNYRGGEARATRSSGSTPSRGAAGPVTAGPFPAVSDRERSGPPMSESSPAAGVDLELLLRKIIREETGLSPAVPADKWRGGEMVLRPGKPGLQEKSWPIETLFNKVVMIRNRLRSLEQQVNGSELPADVKLKLQGYLTGCYGSLTSFNVLFADEDDKFRGGSKG